ncbi:dTMP kinase [Hippea sp. KM1]|uniref:dTMP kinase n=1 Tax=Hippea sp. KM1 TaxID=944481 RepID=UPI00046D6654|nr:dTMP kinase [Hippea sp. KM1]
MHQRKHPKSCCKYIAFEGIDGCGKSTQAELFVSFLKREGYGVYFTKEPSVEVFRDLLLNSNLTDKAKLFLFLADRAQGIAKIRQALNEGLIVVSDRSLYSTIAYQGFGIGVDVDFLKKANEIATGGLKPDVVFFIDIAIDEMKRRLRKPDSIESKSEDFFRRVRDGYLELSKMEKGFYLIDGSGSIEGVFDRVLGVWRRI